MAQDGIEIAYGRGFLPVKLPAAAAPTVIRKAVIPALPDNRAAIRDALEQPIAARPLAALARGRSSACILICDITRPVPNRLFLRPDDRDDGRRTAFRSDRIDVLVATGLHRPNEGDELAELVGDPWVHGERARREPLRPRRREDMSILA